MDNPPNTNDHDLIITVKEKVNNILEEVRFLRDGNNERLKNVELNKLDKAEFSQFKIDLKETIAEMQKDQNRIMSDMQRENNKSFNAQIETNKSVASDIKALFRMFWIITGIGIVIELFAKELIPLIINNLK